MSRAGLDPLTALLASQEQVLRVDQALASCSTGRVRWLLTSGRWQRRYPLVLVAHSGPLTRAQEIWAALLHCGRGAVLGGATAAELDGLTGYAEDPVNVLVPHGARPRRGSPVVPAGNTVELAIMQSRLLGAQYVHPARRPVRTRIERSVLDMASGRKRDADAVAVLAASVQQRLTTASRLDAMLTVLPRLSQRRMLAETLADVRGGAHSLPEVAFRRLVAGAGLPPPDSQSVLGRANGRYYLDAEWRRQRVAAETDGLSHLEVSRWLADLERQNALAVGRLTVVRFASFHIRHRQAYVAATLRALLG